MTTDFEELLLKVAKILEDLKIAYFITGGYAVSVWGRPRSTFDVDVAVQLFANDVAPLARRLRELSQDGYIDEAVAGEALDSGGEFNFIHPESGIKIDFWVTKGDEFAKLQLKRRRSQLVSGRKIFFVSPEDLILNKLLWYKESESGRQLEDAESIVRISGRGLDQHYLNRWAGKLGVSVILKNLYKRCRGA